MRRSTLRIRSAPGIRKNRPGPRAPTRRPRRKITPRSYSCTILMVEVASKNTTRATGDENDDDGGHPEPPFPCPRAHNQNRPSHAGPAGFAIDSTRCISEPDLAASGFAVSELVSVWHARGGPP